jgi:hypothetical protein
LELFPFQKIEGLTPDGCIHSFPKYLPSRAHTPTGVRPSPARRETCSRTGSELFRDVIVVRTHSHHTKAPHGCGLQWTSPKIRILAGALLNFLVLLDPLSS